MIHKRKILVIILIAIISPLIGRMMTMPAWVSLVMIAIFWLVNKSKNTFILVILIVILVVVNLIINRLLYINLNPIGVSFDREQSYLDYPGIENSISRYYQEGLWLPYSLRNVFYGSYLKILPWIGGVFKLLSPTLWVKMLGFSGFSLLLLGMILYFKNTNKNIIFLYLFGGIIFSSALRVLGDSVVAIYLTIPIIIYLIGLGINNKIFKKFYIFWYGLVIIDILLR